MNRLCIRRLIHRLRGNIRGSTILFPPPDVKSRLEQRHKRTQEISLMSCVIDYHEDTEDTRIFLQNNSIHYETSTFFVFIVSLWLKFCWLIQPLITQRFHWMSCAYCNRSHFALYGFCVAAFQINSLILNL